VCLIGLAHSTLANEAPPALPTVDADGAVRVLPVAIPLSQLASDESKRNLLDYVVGYHTFMEAQSAGEGGTLAKAFTTRWRRRA
jgi:hypothetical protein